jgi:hypothetical protein
MRRPFKMEKRSDAPPDGQRNVAVRDGQQGALHGRGNELSVLLWCGSLIPRAPRFLGIPFEGVRHLSERSVVGWCGFVSFGLLHLLGPCIGA